MATTILLNPGPVNVSPRVRAALLGPDLCHREPEFSDLQDAIRGRLLEVFDLAALDYTAVLLTGSGTAVVEAMIASAIGPDGRLLVLQNGVYGERMARMARAHGIACDVVSAAWTERPAVDEVASAMSRATYHALAVVHHETTTGLLNDLAPIAALCRDRGIRLLVDAVSSLAGERFDFAALRPDAVACTANKCVQGLPGLSFALVRRPFIDEMSAYPERSVYLHLPRHHAEQDKRSTPFTPAIQIARALRAALDELAEETVSSRIGRYARASAVVRGGLRRLGIELLLPDDLRSNTLTAARLPEGMSYDALHDALKAKGFVIYAGQSSLASTMFRVATMGAVPEAEYHRFVEALGDVLPALPALPARPAHAIILAAGLGIRLRPRTEDIPKGLIEVGGEPLVGRSLRLLRAAGITRVTIVGGHLIDRYRAFMSSRADDVALISNEDYATTGSMASLAVALRDIDEPVLILESDIIYEPRALEALMAAPADDATLLSGPTGAGDEVWTHAPEGLLTAMNKDPTALPGVTGEFVGVTRLSREGRAAMLRAFDAFTRLQGHGRMDYETGALMAVAATRPVSAVLVADLCWGEIDDERQLTHVVTHVWPRLSI